LVNLKQKSITEFLVNTSLYSGWVGDEQIISDNLNFVTHLSGHFDVGFEIVLVEWILDGDERIFVTKTLIKSDGLVLGEDSIVKSGLLTEVVSFGLSVVELRGSDI